MYKCSSCLNEVQLAKRSYDRNVKRNGKFICQSCRIRSYAGTSLSKRNKDKKFIEKSKSGLKKYWNSKDGLARKDEMKTSEYTSRLSNQAKKAWTNSDYKNKHSEVSRKNANDPKFIEMLRESSKKTWENECYRNTIINNIDHEACSIHAKKMWKNEKIRKKIIKSIKDRWNDEEWRKKWHERIMSDEVRMRCAKSRENNLVSLGLEKSKPHKMTTNILNDLNISFIEEHAVGFYNFDIFLPNYNMLIEVNGDYWHGLPKAIRNDRSKSTYIAKYFQQYNLKTIWEHELMCPGKIEKKIRMWVGINDVEMINFNIKSTCLKLIDTKSADFFLSKYHYLRGVGRNAICFGSYIDEKLIAVCCFASITRKETAERLNMKSSEMRELTRFCIHPLYHKKNFASHVIAKSISEFKKQKSNIKMLVSFADSTFGHDGIIYKACNWILDGIVKPSYWYVDKDNYVMHKKTLWDHAKSLKMNENDFAKSYGYKKVYGMKKYRYLIKLI